MREIIWALNTICASREAMPTGPNYNRPRFYLAVPHGNRAGMQIILGDGYGMLSTSTLIDGTIH